MSRYQVLEEGLWPKDGVGESPDFFCVLQSPTEYQKVTGRENSS